MTAQLNVCKVNHGIVGALYLTSEISKVSISTASHLNPNSYKPRVSIDYTAIVLKLNS